jgi:pimeloyl-ACP methyl ester carboxylesterase
VPDPIRAVVLVHGAGSGPWVFDGWAEALDGVDVCAVDLQAGLAVEHAAMSNYRAVVTSTAGLLARPLALCGWSMGGLVAMTAAEAAGAVRLALLEPSPPAEVQGRHAAEPLAEGVFDPEAVYGRFPAGIRARAESALARAERRRGLSVPALACPALVVHGEEFPEERGRRVGERYGAEVVHVPGASHWDLVLDPAVRALVGAWLLDRGTTTI